MEGELSLDNILGAEEIDSLFLEDDEVQDASPDKEEPSKEEEIKNNNNEATEVVNADNLFSDEEPESVGSGQDDKEEKEGTDLKGNGASPKNFYSSIAKALREEGIFPDLDDKNLADIVCR